MNATITKLLWSGRRRSSTCFVQPDDSPLTKAEWTLSHHKEAIMFLQKLRVYLTSVVMFCYMISLNVTLRIIYFFSPKLFEKLLLSMGKTISMTQNPNFRFEDWAHTFKSLAFIKNASAHMWLSLGQEAFTGGPAPDSAVVSLDGQMSSILKFMKENRPLVLSFGSCT